MLRRNPRHLSSSSSSSSLFAPTALLRGSTNRYTDGSGRPLDGSEIPRDLYLPPMNNPETKNAYPARTGHWQPMVAGKVKPYRGTVVVSGAGVVGSATAILFGLRGWHVTVVEQQKPAAVFAQDGGGGTELNPISGLSDQTFEMALMTKRGMDVLYAAGLRNVDIARVGTKVSGVLDHASSSMSTFLTRGLAEMQAFSVNNLVVDLHALRQRLHLQLAKIPYQNGKIFFEHKSVAHLPEQKVLVVKPLALDPTIHPDGEEAQQLNTTEKSVMIHGVKFDEHVEGISYDLLIAADGRDSPLRRMMALDDTAEFAEKNFSISWFVVEDCDVDPTVIHRWLHQGRVEDNPLGEYPAVFAYPRGIETGSFSVMAYLPMSIASYYFGENSSNSSSKNKPDGAGDSSSESSSTPTSSSSREERAYEFVKNWCPELATGRVAFGTVSKKPQPAPSVYLLDHYNVHTPFPNSLLLGDAAHTCHPFLLQGLVCALEDTAYAVNICDSRGKNSYDNIRQFSMERGVAADRLRNVTDRSLYFHRHKHWNPVLRARNSYAQFMHVMCPRIMNEQVSTSSNYRFPKSVEAMLNGRGYTAYEEIDAAQTRNNRFWAFSRIYT